LGPVCGWQGRSHERGKSNPPQLHRVLLARIQYVGTALFGGEFGLLNARVAKSEARNPRPERRPKSEARSHCSLGGPWIPSARGAAACRAEIQRGPRSGAGARILRISAFPRRNLVQLECREAAFCGVQIRLQLD
jgi:hypothetical protein